MTELQLQIAVAKLLDSLGWRWTHVPNEGKRSKGGGANLKRAGLKKGVPDVLVCEEWEWWTVQAPKGQAVKGSGIAIELKVAKGKTSAEQKEWLAALKERGWLTAVCYSLDEVMDILRHVRPLNGRRLEG